MSAQNQQQPNQQPDPMSLVVRPRSDLRVTRQLVGDEVVYVIQDPVSFATHRLDAFQYLVLTSIDAEMSLKDNFARMVSSGTYDEDEQDVFLALVGTFRQLGLVILPMAGAKLFDKAKQIHKARVRSKVLGALFARFPLVRPDAFLTRTVNWVSWLFSPWFVALWLVGLVAACSIIAIRFGEFTQPLSGLLATKNLPFLWLSFVVLKVWHELGHGYACKKYGGFVPEMGAILIAGTPAAYVDATAAWSFPHRSHRLAVMCGGMFFESLVFIAAVFLWAFASDPMIAACAHQLVVLASLATILFNANPLMRFDGYFILSELVGIQNLRPRADRQIKAGLSRFFLGLKSPETSDSKLTRCLLYVYGVSASIYKFFLVIGIAMSVAVKFPMIGLFIAASYVVMAAVQTAFRTLNYLLRSPESKSVRPRARLVAAALAIGVPVSLMALPVPTGVKSQGLVSAEHEYFLNVDTPGAFQNTMVSVGREVQANQPISRLDNPRVVEDLSIAQSALNEARVRTKAATERGPAAVAWERTSLAELQREVAMQERLVKRLDVVAPATGKVVWQRPRTDHGKFLAAGEPIARVAAGRTILRTWVSEEQLGSLKTEPGSLVQFRVLGGSTATHTGHLLSIRQASEEIFSHAAVTYVVGGDILLDPETGRPIEPIFQIDILPDPSAVRVEELNSRVYLMLPRRSESIGGWAYRSCVRFVRALMLA